MKNAGSINHLKNKNQGFSLVEVLVCLAIIAIFCIPLFQGFRYAAYNNNKAHHTQEATAYAQKTLEAVKSMRMDEDNPDAAKVKLEELLKETAGGTITTSAIPDTGMRDTFNGTDGALVGNYVGNDKYNKLFTVITYSQKDIEIGGRMYHMKVELDPRPYSVQPDVKADIKVDEIDSEEDDTSANDANVYGIAPVNEIDGLKFPLIADEIHRYEEGQAILNTFQAGAEAIGKPDAFEHNNKKIYKDLHKRILVTIAQQGASETVTVTCDVEYKIDCEGVPLKEVYNVYTGSFDLDCGKGCSDRDPDSGLTHSHFTEWESGGKIFIFAKAYKDEVMGHIAANEVIIESTYDGIHKAEGLDVYLVRGVYSYASDNFSLVEVNGTPYSIVPDSSTYLVGEKKCGNINLHTNIKGKLGDILVNPLASEREQTIGKEEPRLRSYDVTVTLTERDSGKVVAQVTTTKKVM